LEVLKTSRFIASTGRDRGRPAATASGSAFASGVSNCTAAVSPYRATRRVACHSLWHYPRRTTPSVTVTLVKTSLACNGAVGEQASGRAPIVSKALSSTKALSLTRWTIVIHLLSVPWNSTLRIALVPLGMGGDYNPALIRVEPTGYAIGVCAWFLSDDPEPQRFYVIYDELRGRLLSLGRVRRTDRYQQQAPCRL